MAATPQAAAAPDDAAAAAVPTAATPVRRDVPLRPPLLSASGGGGSSGSGKSSISRLLRDAVARQQEEAAALANLASAASAAAAAPSPRAGEKSSAWDEAIGLCCMVTAFLCLVGVGVIIAMSVQGGADGSGFDGRPAWVAAHLPVMQRGGARGDVATEVRVTLAQLAMEAVVNVSFSREATCAVCGGVGGSGTVRCPACQGAGSVPAFGGMMRAACGHCGGRGVKHAHVCPTCGGSGGVRARVDEAVRLTAGLVGGDVVRLVGAGGRNSVRSGGGGGSGSGGGMGDVEVTIVEVVPSAQVPGVVTRCSDPAYCAPGRNDDLLVRVRLTLGEALLGWQRTISHPRGGVVHVGAAAGEVTQPGELLRYAGHGMPRRSAAATSRTFFTSGGAVQHELQQPGAPPDRPRGEAWMCRLPLVGPLVCPPSSAAGALIVVAQVDLPPALTAGQAAAARLLPPPPPPPPQLEPAPRAAPEDDATEL